MKNKNLMTELKKFNSKNDALKGKNKALILSKTAISNLTGGYTPPANPTIVVCSAYWASFMC
jgi:hypothetical protein